MYPHPLLQVVAGLLRCVFHVVDCIHAKDCKQRCKCKPLVQSRWQGSCAARWSLALLRGFLWVSIAMFLEVSFLGLFLWFDSFSDNLYIALSLPYHPIGYVKSFSQLEKELRKYYKIELKKITKSKINIYYCINKLKIIKKIS